MWHASSGDTTFTGPYALMLAEGIKQVIAEMNEFHAIGKDGYEYETGIQAFDVLTREQKIWSLHKVAFGLLDKKTPMASPTAYLEATIAAVFYQLDSCIQIEQDMEVDFVSDPDIECDCFFWRKLVLAAYESQSDDFEEQSDDFEDDEELLTIECRDIEKWRFALEILKDQIFWDADYEDIDMIPALQDVYYYASGPDEPEPIVAEKLMREINKLCDLVIKRERKKIDKRKK